MVELDVVLARSHYPNGSECSLSSLLHTAAAAYGNTDLKSMQVDYVSDSMGGGAHSSVCGSVPPPAFEKQVIRESMEFSAEAGLGPPADLKISPVADQEIMMRHCSSAEHDAREIMVAENAISLQGSGIASECAPKGLAAPAQIEGSSHPQVSGTPLVDVRAGCQSKGKEDRGEVSATVFSWRKPEEAAVLLRAVCEGWGAVVS